MHYFELPTDKVDYLQLAFPVVGSGLIARWGTQFTPFTVATWNGHGSRPNWQLSDRPLSLSPDGQWISVYDKVTGDVRITQVGLGSTAVIARGRGVNNVWTAVAPGRVAVAWKDEPYTVVRTLPNGELVAQIKTGFGYDLQFTPGGRWLTEIGKSVFRVFDRNNGYRVFARIKTPRFTIAKVTDGLTAVVAAKNGTVDVWNLASKSVMATLPVGGSVSALAISADGRRVLTGNLECEVTLWDTAGIRRAQYNWGVEVPIAAEFAPDGMRAAVGGSDGQIAVWDLDD